MDTDKETIQKVFGGDPTTMTFYVDFRKYDVSWYEAAAVLQEYLEQSERLPVGVAEPRSTSGG